MAKGTRKPRQPRRVAVRFASRKKTLWQRRYRGSVKARNMTMRVRRPLKGTLRKKIRSHATPSKKVKNTREPNCFLRSCAREKLNQAEKGTKYDHEGQKTSKRNLEKENPIARHSVEEGTKYDHEGQKTSKRNLEKENPIARHSVEEGEEHKRTKLFSPFLCT
ncbi:hypothetical protein R6Z07F_020234 [Ovis aries]